MEHSELELIVVPVDMTENQALASDPLEFDEYLDVSSVLQMLTEIVDVEHSDDEDKPSTIRLVLGEGHESVVKLLFKRLGRPIPMGTIVAPALSQLLLDFLVDESSTIQIKTQSENKTMYHYFSGLEVLLNTSRLEYDEDINTLNLACLINGVPISPYVDKCFLTLSFERYFVQEVKPDIPFGNVSFDDGETYFDSFSAVKSKLGVLSKL